MTIFALARKTIIGTFIMPTQLPTCRIATTTQLSHGLLLLIMSVSLYTSLVVLNTLGVEDYGIYKVEGANVSMFASVNLLLALANGGKTSGCGFEAMKITVKLSWNSLPTSGQRNPTWTNLGQLGQVDSDLKSNNQFVLCRTLTLL